MSMNLCCFYFLTRPRNKVEIAPIENHSKIQPEVIIQESPKIEEIPEGITKKLSKQIINKKQIIVAQISKYQVLLEISKSFHFKTVVGYKIR